MGVETVGGASMNILEELYHGNIRPSENRFNHPSKYVNVIKVLCDNEQKLTEFLKALPNAEKEQQMLSKMINAQSEISNFAEIEKFIEGFRLGAKFVLDTFIIEQESAIKDIT